MSRTRFLALPLELLRRSRRADKWRANELEHEEFTTNLQLFDSIEYSHIPIYKDKSFLQQKYVVEGLSVAQIAAQIFTSKEAIRCALIDHGIPLRKPHQHHGRPAQVPFGKKRRNDRVVENLAEQRTVQAIMDLRKQNLSLRQIAKFLDQIGVPTKCRGKAWHPNMVARIIDRYGQPTNNKGTLNDTTSEPSLRRGNSTT